MKKNTAGKNFITALIIIGVFCFAGWIASMFDSGPRCIETGCYRRQEPDSDYCYDHELYREESSTDDESSSDDKSSTDSSTDSGSSKKHIIISTTIVTVILIHLTAIIQEKIHMEHLVPPKSIHTILMMRGMMTSIWMVIMMITDMTMTVTMQMV